MTRLQAPRSLRQPSLPIVAALTLAAASLALPRIAGAQAAVTSSQASSAPAEPGRVIVRLTNVSFESNAAGNPALLVYASGPARVGVAGEPPRPLTDTLRLDRVQPLTLDVTESDVHIRLATPGTIRYEGPVAGATGANRLGAGGRHIVFVRGGNEVKVLK